ncbi:cytochrome c oxidase assembly protein COX16-domain-containing protein [Mycotypha africana]|uniref:cytochrome c oxidase assembly protein COX16-domain-containing protein n=1 Tax=Mycotypha africana TaxID=64632 RepID=UPI0023015E23|nr:cytochrome c oxidase assembly protein COX16-domain-containing protein [Mycotypha africana]KAI8991475.1 cytochrome c oxidase assembly protein COX16-domain-containing protein [Mycotypha africana]
MTAVDKCLNAVFEQRGENKKFPTSNSGDCDYTHSCIKKAVKTVMVKFQNKPYGKENPLGPLAAHVKKKPFLYFGLPFVGIIVAGSFGLAQLTQTKYDHRDRRHTQVAKEEALGMDKNRRKLSLQEEYFVTFTSKDRG